MTPKSTTVLTIAIEEDASGAIEVGWGATDKETGEKIAMRPSHILGQLFAAAFFVVLRSYSSFKEELTSLVDVKKR